MANGLANGTLPPPLSKEAQALSTNTLPGLDASKLTIIKKDEKDLKPLPDLDGLVFGAHSTDHMLLISFDPSTGWSDPLIKPYGPLSLDPACAVFQYCPVAFEGLKAYLDPQGRPRLFRPDLNMERLRRSVERAALPAFDESAFLILLKRLISLEKRWIPSRRGYSLYIRPTVIGTRPALGVAASTHSLLYIILSPSGPYFPTGIKPIRILASCDCSTNSTMLNPDGDKPARSWPGGTGEFKLGINYAPAFDCQRDAARRGFDQVLWVLDDMVDGGQRVERRITELGQMNLFVVIKRDDGDVDLITPRLDGTILPGITRSSILTLCASHTPNTPLHPSLPTSIRKIHTHERTLYMSHLHSHLKAGTLLEAFGASTAAVVVPIGVFGYEGQEWTMPTYEGGLGPVGRSVFERITDVQEGRDGKTGNGEGVASGWSVLCE